MDVGTDASGQNRGRQRKALTRCDWLLLLVMAVEACGRRALDPVRLQKGAFLLAMDGRLPAGEVYEFVPYSYGPMSREVYRDVDRLVSRVFIDAIPEPGYRWERYRATTSGRTRARVLLARLRATRPSDAALLGEIAVDLARMSFEELLTFVYRRYPEFAVRSVFRRR